MKCRWCGSSKHISEKCNIKQKAGLMQIGIPPEHLFDFIIEIEYPQAKGDEKETP